MNNITLGTLLGDPALGNGTLDGNETALYSREDVDRLLEEAKDSIDTIW
jgi:phage terminase large subunit-like protein